MFIRGILKSKSNHLRRLPSILSRSREERVVFPSALSHKYRLFTSPSQSRFVRIYSEGNQDKERKEMLGSKLPVIAGEFGVMEALKLTKTPKILFSCASNKDKEFLTLLQHIQKNRRVSINPLDDILFKNSYEAPLLIFREGFLIGFDNLETSVPNHLIQVIRGIKLTAAFQTYKMLMDLQNKKLACANYKLDPALQKIVVEALLDDQPQGDKYCVEKSRHQLTDVNELRKLSPGRPYLMELPEVQNHINPKVRR